ncbi:hypothetical protein GSI_00196 [Ganoderma sinense ZZ0214-1]|uniref:Uncharacterized protein n=1 Tax=Ganoderma sinense ZZ0214-1 TaxID=1077348 RepID=A0A2G8SRW0_9APHY|nr:hypothetical protein GSI_00196 [Ganoderma sinense ZZ0214-1]
MAHCRPHPNLTRLAIDLNFILSTRLSPRALIPFQARSKSTSTYLDQITRKLNFVCGELDLDTGEERDSSSATGAVSKSLQDELNLPSQPQLKLSTHYISSFPRPTKRPNHIPQALLSSLDTTVRDSPRNFFLPDSTHTSRDWKDMPAIFLPFRHEDPPDTVNESVPKHIREGYADLLPDHPAFDAVFARQVKRGNYEAVFAMYSSMMEHHTPTARPDARAFIAVFDAIRRTTLSSRSSPRRLGIETPRNTPSPRAVLKDMLACLERRILACQNRNDAALHAALQTFMAQRDYAAALTAVRLCRTFHFSLPTLAAYRTVVNPLAERIQAHPPPDSSSNTSNSQLEAIFASRFFGLHDRAAAGTHAQPGPAHASPRRVGRLDPTVIARVLAAGLVSPLELDYIPVPKFDPGTGEALFPHTPGCVGLPSPLALARELRALEQILDRAVLASLPKLGRTPAYRQMQASAVVEAAEAEMHPRCDPSMRGMLGSEHRGANFSLLSALAQVRT